MAGPSSDPARAISPGGLITLDESCTPVLDADEEIFELYAELSLRDSGASAGPDTGSSIAAGAERIGSGLGFLDSKKDLLELDLEIVDPALGHPFASPELSRSPEPEAGLSPPHRARRLRRAGSYKEEKKRESVQVTASIAQDLGALRNRKGDTGSVIWRSSLLLARRLLAQRFFPPDPSDASERTILDPSIAARMDVLELGSGTGILPVLLQRSLGPDSAAPKKTSKSPPPGTRIGVSAPAPFRSWTATDRFDNLKLIERNIRLNSVPCTSIAELDWESLPRRWEGQVGLVLAVDCLFNEALVRPFVDALERVAGMQTSVMVVVELRSSDVLQLFLETWLSSSSTSDGNQKTRWTIHRLSEAYVGRALSVRSGFVAWVGWKEVVPG